MSENVENAPIAIEENGKAETEEKNKQIEPDTKIEQIENDSGPITEFEEDDLPLDLILKEENEQQARHDAMDTKVPECTTVEEIEKDKAKVCAFEFCGLCKANVANRQAKLLGCLHTFCAACLEKEDMQRLTPDGKLDTKVLCPVCRCLTPRTLLAENHFVQIENPGEGDQKDQTKLCSSCDEEELPGVKFCLDCKEWLCEGCVAAHRRVKLTKTHVLGDEPPKADENPERLCPIHPTEPLQLFCDSCDLLTCRDCQLQNHRDHRYDYVKEAAFRERKMLMQVHPELLMKKKNLTAFQKLAADRLTELTKKEEHISNQIDTYVGEIIAQIKRKQEEFHATVRHVIGSRKREVNSQLNTSKKLLKAINHSQDFIGYISDHSKTRGLLCARKLVKDYFNLIIREPTPSAKSLHHCNSNIAFNHNNNMFRTLVHNKLGEVIFEQVRPLPTGLPPSNFPQMRPQGIRLAPGQIPPGWQPASGKPGRPPMQMPQGGPQRIQHVPTSQQHRQHQQKPPHMPPNPLSPNLYHQRVIPPQYQQQVRPPHVISPGPRSNTISPNVQGSPMSPKLLSPNNPGRPHSTDSGHSSSDIVGHRYQSSTPPINQPPAKQNKQIVQTNGKHKPQSNEIENEDWCAVCWNGGELLCCDSCPKVFHLNCHVPEIKTGFPDGDFNCTLCSFKNGTDNENLAICRFIFCSVLSDRQLDPLQLFSRLSEIDEQFKATIRKPVYFTHIRKKLNQSEAPYAHVENLLNDMAQFLQNIRKFAVESKYLDAAELATHVITEKVRKVKPSAVHYWVSLSMRPNSPLLTPKVVKPKPEIPKAELPPPALVQSGTVALQSSVVMSSKRVAMPKSAESDSDEESAKRVKISAT